MLKPIFILLSIMMSMQLFAQGNSKQQFNSDKEQLSALNARFIQDFLHNDTVAHNKIVYKDFICIGSNGAAINRDDYMKGWSHGYDPNFYRSFKMQNEWIRVFGNTALVRAETYYSFMEEGKEVFKTTVYTDTYIKLDGRWWCIQAQLTPKK
jgi:hypothetical protein